MTFSRVMRLGSGAAFAVALAACTTLMGEPEIGVTRTGDNPAPPVASDGGDTAAAQAASENARIIDSYGGVYRDRDAEVMLARLVSRLLTADQRDDESYSITILDSPQVNAFALPGGYIYVTRGLLALANDASEVAAVLAHEMAHVTLRHAQARSNRVRTTEIVDRVLGGILGVDLETDQSANRSRASLAAFSQRQEFEADDEGIRVAAAAGYDPTAAARFLGFMGRYAALTEGQNAAILSSGDFLSSHPSTPARIDRAAAAARAIGERTGETGREAYLAAIDGLLFGNNPDNGAVVDDRFVHQQLDFTFTVPARYSLANTDDAVVATVQNGPAMRFDGADVPADMGLEDYLKSGWIAGLVPDSVRTVETGGNTFAVADARTEQWVFRIAALRHEGMVYRFIFAAASDSERFENEFMETIRSFRNARASDIRRIRSLRLTVVQARPGDTTASLAARMEVNRSGTELFLTLNGLFAGDPITPGARYKLVTAE